MKWIVTVQAVIDPAAHGFVEIDATADDVIGIVDSMLTGGEKWPDAALITEARCPKVRTP